MKTRNSVFTACLLFSSLVFAHQPVMDMAPRWDDGYGFQIRYESYGSDTLLDGDSEVANPSGLKRYVNKTWFEGVYTFDRAIRATFKLPYISQRRTKNINGTAVRQRNSGFGDLVLGLPLKYYRNRKAFTENFSFTPSIRLPTGSSSGDFALSDGSVDYGFSLSYSSESPKYYTLFDLYYWLNTEGDRGMHEGDELALDINLGYHPYHNNDNNSGVFTMLDISARYNDDPSSATLTTASGGQRVQTGPVLVLYKDNIMFRTEYKHLVYEKTSSISNARGNEFMIGLGITF
ncbi:MAG: transporter [Proteobacteria bacterium]|nr:transporter [Pseudomonadota bacterium]